MYLETEIPSTYSEKGRANVELGIEQINDLSFEELILLAVSLNLQAVKVNAGKGRLSTAQEALRLTINRKLGRKIG
jgi:hypothetical protein